MDTTPFPFPALNPRLWVIGRDLITNVSPSAFEWRYRSRLTGANLFHLQVDNDSDFSSPFLDQPSLEKKEFNNFQLLTDGTYYWRFRVKDLADNWGKWSEPWRFTVNTQVPVLMDLVDGIVINEARPTFDWSDVDGAAVYHLQVDNHGDFASPDDQAG